MGKDIFKFKSYCLFNIFIEVVYEPFLYCSYEVRSKLGFVVAANGSVSSCVLEVLKKIKLSLKKPILARPEVIILRNMTLVMLPFRYYD